MTTKPATVHKPLPQQTWPGRSHVAIFVRCLHHLDFDQLEDWPGVTEQLFTAKVAQQSIQQRVKAVEWSLYRLFETYDAAETKDKLRPFFPPTTQLQSLNLRAALYRCLNELKKDGVLGKDVVLRKTMLDDCKGERLEEVLASFAITVLQKARKLPTTNKAPLLESQLMPTILAYRVSLRNNLQIRREESTRAEQTLANLAVSETKLLERLQKATSAQLELDTEKQRFVRDFVGCNWIGNHAWSNTLLAGIPGPRVVEEDDSTDRHLKVDESQRLFEDLSDRIKRHQNRLSEWQVIAKGFATKQGRIYTETSTDELPMAKKASTSAQFSRHKELNLTNWKPESAVQQFMDEPHQRLLNAMKNELAELSAPSPTRVNINKQREAHISPAPLAEIIRSPTPPAAQHVETESSNNDISPSPPRLPTSELVSRSEAVTDSRTRRDSSLPNSPQSVISNKTDTLLASNQRGDIKHVEERSTMSVLNSSPPPIVIDQPPVSPSKMWMSLAERTRASMSLTGRQSILTDPDSSTIHEAESMDGEEVAGPQLSSDEDRRTTLLERTRKSMSMFANASASRPRRPKRTKPSTLPSPPEEEPEASTRAGTATPRDQLFSDDADYASVFKSRPKLAMSPGLEPRRSISPLVHENGLDALDAGFVPRKNDSRWK